MTSKVTPWNPVMIILLLTVFSFACGRPQDSIVGRWRMTNGNEVLNFYSDGSIDIATTGFFGATEQGKYQFIDNKHLRISKPGLFGPTTLTYEVVVNDKELRLIDAQGAMTHYSKVK